MWFPDEEEHLACCIPHARSSTECELVALALALPRCPSQILTDSLCSLQLLGGWGRYAVSRILQCDLRGLVRQVLALARQCPEPPVFEQVQAHNEAWIRLGHPKAVGNDRADALAKAAVSEPGRQPWPPLPPLYRDVVEILEIRWGGDLECGPSVPPGMVAEVTPGLGFKGYPALDGAALPHRGSI